MYDLLLKGGTVLDPSGGLDGALDVAVQSGAIARIAPGIAETEAARTIDVRGKIVTPGLIDLHAHVFEGFNRTGVNPDLGGVYAGVTTIVDAGSAGAATFGGFPRHILPELPHRDHPVPAHLPDRAGHACPTSSRRAASTSTTRSEGGRPAPGPDPRDQGAHGLARARDHGHGDAAAGQAGGRGERREADGAHRRHREALRPEGDPLAAAAARAGRHPDPLLHRQPGRRPRRQRQAGARGEGGGGPRRVVRHRARADELQLRRRPPRDRAGRCSRTASAPTSPCPAGS